MYILMQMHRQWKEKFIQACAKSGIDDKTQSLDGGKDTTSFYSVGCQFYPIPASVV